MNRLGVQGYTIREYIKDKAQFTDTLQKLRSIGYTCLDHGIPQGMTAREYGKLLRNNGFEPLKVDSDIASLLADPEKHIKNAYELGVDLVMSWSIPKELRGGEEGYHRFAEDLNKIGNILHREGLRFGYHSHAFEFVSFGGYTGLDILLNETEHLELIPDTHWLAAGGVDPANFIRRFGARCRMIHFKDYAIQAGTDILENVPRTYAEVGQGNLNWPSIVQACREVGISTFCVEQDYCKVDPFTSLAISYRAMKQLGL